jgi:hypothetical protein
MAQARCLPNQGQTGRQPGLQMESSMRKSELTIAALIFATGTFSAPLFAQSTAAVRRPTRDVSLA